MGFFPIYTVREVVRILLFKILFVGSCNSPQPRPIHRCSRTLRRTTRCRARMCLFRVRKK